jgi:pyruvate dehydrogenase E1 component alpha subunit
MSTENIAVEHSSAAAESIPPLLDMYREMARIRALGAEAENLQRQGVLPAFAGCVGQEAAQVGSAFAMDRQRDFAFVTYREFGAMIALGIDPVDLLAHHRGFADGGRFNPLAAHVSPLYSVVGGTVLHATGWAMGAALDRSGACAIAYFGDGASSQGDVHEAMNFAAVFKAPVIFFCQNNGWAISVPTAAQVGGGSIAARAAGYGLPGVRIDGNDVEEVYAATAEAVARAREGRGATVIEAMTYRLSPHASSDDPRRYRTEEEEEEAREREPLPRARARLLARGNVDVLALDEIDLDIDREVRDVSAQVMTLDPPAIDSLLDLAYRDTPPQTRRADNEWLATVALS